MSWEPLSGSDPVPGNPGAVDTYATSLTRTADVISEQIGMLRRLADPANWEADTADAFREQASDLAKDIDKAEGRYRAVGSELSAWSTVLEAAQRSARAKRDLAQSAQRRVDSNPVPVPATNPDTMLPELTPGQQSQLRVRQAAEDEIDRLRGELDRLVDETDQQAWEHGRRIRAALDDDVANNWFDRLKAKLSGISDVLKQVAKWAGYVALALGVIALVIGLVITAPAWLLGLAAAATFVAMVAGIGLALSENGSWWAPVFDFVSLCTFGVARWAKLGAKAAMGVARPIVGRAREAAANAGYLARYANSLGLASRLSASTSRLVPGVVRVPSGWYVGYRNWQAGRAGAAALRTVDVVPSTSFWQNVLHNGKGQAGLRAQANQFLQESTDAEVIKQALAARRLINVSVGTAAVADLSSLVGSFVKESGPTTELGRWRIFISRGLKGFS